MGAVSGEGVSLHEDQRLERVRGRGRAVRRAGHSALALLTGLSGVIAVVALGATSALAAFPNQLPYMCFTPAGTFHQVFGPNSFFLNENQQGPTGFRERGPNSAPTVVLPLHTGKAAGHSMYYVITDASDRTVAQELGVNFTPKLANAAGAPSVQLSASNDPRSIVAPAGVDFSPDHVLVPGPSGFPPSAAAPGAVGDPGYTPLVQLPSGVILNAPQIGDGTNLVRIAEKEFPGLERRA